MTTSRNKVSVDTWVNQQVPTKNYDTFTIMQVGSVTNQVRYSYCLIGLPFSRGAKTNVHDAKFRIWNHVAWTGTFTLRIRPITSSWNRNGMTWNGTGWRARPTVSATVVDVTKVNPAAKTMWEFDVEAILQSVSNGTAWYGFRIEMLTASVSPRNLTGSTNWESAYRPEMVVEYSPAPEAPARLTPAQGRAISRQYPTFQSDFVDVSGSTNQGGMQIQLDSAGTDAGGVDYDSTVVDVSSPEIVTEPSDPARPVGMPAWGGLADNASTYWRCKVEDAAGLLSSWSAWEPFNRQIKGTLVITSPGTTVSDSSFTAAWTYTTAGVTSKYQTKYQVIVRDTAGKEMYNSQVVTSTDAYHPLPSTIKLRDDTTYVCEVRVWDQLNRQAMPGDQQYVSATKTFTYAYDVTVTPINTLTVAQFADSPWVVFYFNRASIPDKFNVYRDNVLFWSGDAGELYLPGPTNYGFLDRLAPAHEEHTWKFVAVVNGLGSQAVSITYTPKIPTSWVGAPSIGGLWIWNASVEMIDDNREEVVEFVGNYSAAVVQTGEHGKTGTISGKITPESNTTLTSMQDIKSYLDYIFDNPGVVREIHIVNEAFFGYLRDYKATPRKDTSGVYYDISFSFGENI